MDLEKLTKHQIVLLTLLVSFVTSIATGIVTVSLMSQEPGGVTRTINQIVERTVEKVVPTEQGAAVAVAAPAQTTVTERTVVVKDDDLTAASIAQVQKSVVRITEKGSDLLLTRGVIVSASGATIVDRSAIIKAGGKEFEAILYSGERVPALLRLSAATSSIAVLDIVAGTTTVLSPAKAADISKLKLGQSVIRIGGTGSDSVGTGVLARLPQKDSHPNLIEASVSSATPGSVLITLFGEVVGIVTGESAAQGADTYTTTESMSSFAPVKTPSTSSS